MNNLPRISLIIPSYNQGRYIEQTLCSVIDQDYDNLELIVIDGESWDETRDILPMYADRIDTLIVEPDRGPADAINKGLAAATGDIIAIINSDDVLLPGALAAVAIRFAQGDCPCWIVGHSARINEDGELIGTADAVLPDSFLSFLMHDSGVLPSSATFYHRELFHLFGTFDIQLEQAYAYDFACRIMARDITPTIFASPLIARREHDENRSSLFAVERNLEMIDSSEKHLDDLPLNHRYVLAENLTQRTEILVHAEAESMTIRAHKLLANRLTRQQMQQIRQAATRPRQNNRRKAA